MHTVQEWIAYLMSVTQTKFHSDISPFSSTITIFGLQQKTIALFDETESYWIQSAVNHNTALLFYRVYNTVFRPTGWNITDLKSLSYIFDDL